MRKPSQELRNLYTTYLKRRLRPETALEFASDFVLDLINAFGEKLETGASAAGGSKEFAPFGFLLQLNELLSRYKEKGARGLEDVENTLLHDTHLMVATLVRSSLNGGTAVDATQERYQLPEETAADLEWLIEHES